jgi:glycosyltransferase involved in cell wall biosynthesis
MIERTNGNISFQRFKIVVLYTELADYSLSCLKTLSGEGVDIWLVHWPINPEAPFQFDLSFCQAHYSRNQISDEELSRIVSDFVPDLILCSGWMDKGYVKLCRNWKHKATTVLAMDNHWTGSVKQHVAALVAPFTIKRAFGRAFVPGQPQRQYALKLGFKSEAIETGFYAADTEKFKGYNKEIQEVKAKDGAKRFLFLGRYVQHKGIFDLWEAFRRFRAEHQDWELWCVGAGDQYEHRVEGDGIKHFGFVQPDQLLPILKECDVYILPSHFEPWGVSVHEMAVAGFPMILSDKIGAKEAFLKDNENGKVFPSGDVQALYEAMIWVAEQHPSKLEHMGRLSHELGMQNTPQLWAEKLLHMVESHKA